MLPCVPWPAGSGQGKCPCPPHIPHSSPACLATLLCSIGLAGQWHPNCSSAAQLLSRNKTKPLPTFFFFKFKEGKSFKLGEYLQIVLTDPHIKCCGSFSAYILSFLTFPGKETVLFAFFPFPSPEAVRTRESYRSFLLCFAERIAMPPR